MKTIKEIALDVIKNDDVQPGYPDWNNIQILKKKGISPAPGQIKGITWCNRAAERIAKLAGYNTYPMLDSFYHDINYTSANTMYRQVQYAINKGLLPYEIKEEAAQELANKNIIVLAIALGHRNGHVAVVVSCDKAYNAKLGARIIQAGGKIGEFYTSEIFVTPYVYPDTLIYFTLYKKEGLHV